MVKVTFTKAFHDQARLQHSVPAYVRSLRSFSWRPQGGYRDILDHSKP